MKLYYFTGTGNSLAVARQLAREIPEADLRPIIGVDPGDRPTGALGMVFPVHMISVPIPVRKYLESADLSGLDYFFAVATHGGTPGNVGGFINHLLNRRGNRRLDDFFTIRMILNTPKGVAPRPLMTMNWAEKIATREVHAMLERTDAELSVIAGKIIARRRNAEIPESPIAQNRSLHAGGLSRLLWKVTDGSRPELDFLLDEESCTKCGICCRVCPTGRVRQTVATPRWDDSRQCWFCYACFNFCPEQAVGVKHYTFKTGRYHHPQISADDVAAQKFCRRRRPDGEVTFASYSAVRR